MVTYSHVVNADIESVWSALLLKIEQPEKFVPGVSGVQIIEKNEDFVMRQMGVKALDGSPEILEKITFAPYQIKFEIVEHPVFSGYVLNIAEAISSTNTKLTFTAYWTNKETKQAVKGPEIEEVLKEAVLNSKKWIETQGK